MSKADTKGNHHLHIELTPAQYQLLTEKARQCGLTRRAFIPRMLEGKDVRVRKGRPDMSVDYISNGRL